MWNGPGEGDDVTDTLGDGSGLFELTLLTGSSGVTCVHFLLYGTNQLVTLYPRLKITTCRFE